MANQLKIVASNDIGEDTLYSLSQQVLHPIPESVKCQGLVLYSGWAGDGPSHFSGG
jgi:hypothetical protein